MHTPHTPCPRIPQRIAQRATVRMTQLVCALALASPAWAQVATNSAPMDDTTTSGARAGSGGSLWAPGSGRALLGLNAGRSNFHVPCGSVYTCDDTDNYWSLYGRSMANDYWGTEVAYVDMGRMDRAGGTTRAHGLNVSLVGKVPIAQSLGLYGKVGALYGRTRTTTGVGADIASGKENGFGISLGAGLSWDFSPKMAAVLEWNRHDFRFQSGRDPVYATSVGLQYKF